MILKKISDDSLKLVKEHAWEKIEVTNSLIAQIQELISASNKGKKFDFYHSEKHCGILITKHGVKLSKTSVLAKVVY